MLVTMTYLRPRSWRSGREVFRLSSGIARQAAAADGFLAGRLRVDRRGGFWTLTGWRDEDAVRAFTHAAAHGAAMPLLGELTSTAQFRTWGHTGPRLPRWRAAHRLFHQQAPEVPTWTRGALARPLRARPARSVSARR